jgi:hypothetical protein
MSEEEMNRKIDRMERIAEKIDARIDEHHGIINRLSTFMKIFSSVAALSFMGILGAIFWAGNISSNVKTNTNAIQELNEKKVEHGYVDSKVLECKNYVLEAIK